MSMDVSQSRWKARPRDPGPNTDPAEQRMERLGRHWPVPFGHDGLLATGQTLRARVTHEAQRPSY
jgi:hypothetical protein